MADIPPGYRRLEGSKIHHLPSTKFLGQADRNETIQILFILRRRPDGQAPPNGPEFYLRTPIVQRQRLPTAEFAASYGASPLDISHVTTFANTAHLTVTEVNAARRTIRAVGTVASMERAFAVKIGRYRRDVVDREGNVTQTETYRGREGFIHLPIRLADMIITVSGLDNRSVTNRNNNDSESDDDPPNTVNTTVPEIAQLYNFPNIFAKKGQTIAILSHGGGYLDSDITSYFDDLDLLAPKITDVCIDDATKSTTKLTETTMDICIAGSAAQGVSIAAYFITDDLKSWVDAVGRIAVPHDGDPSCTVLSCSHYVSGADDSTSLQNRGIDDSWMQSMTMAFEDAAMMGVTVCFASGDNGSASKPHCNKARVQYPPSDPWVLTVGGTTVGDINVNSGAFSEFVWNDSDGGATGGGISDYFPVPWYQQGVGVPPSVNDQQHLGRGIPDVAANASRHSCYKFYINGKKKHIGGTSAAAPLWAGLIALINASLGEQVGCPDLGIGFLNPILYWMYLNPDQWVASGWKPFRNISGPPGPTDNVYQGVDGKHEKNVPGYPSVEDTWDACTGLGSIDGLGLLNCLSGYLQ